MNDEVEEYACTCSVGWHPVGKTCKDGKPIIQTAGDWPWGED